MVNKFRLRKQMDIDSGTEIDEAFYNYGPYMMTNWKRVSLDQISKFKTESANWGDAKFLAVHKFTDALKKNSTNRAIGVCEHCKQEVESSIFLRGSFTVKDIFIISTGFDELI